jgi:hypothetical protein
MDFYNTWKVKTNPTEQTNKIVMSSGSSMPIDGKQMRCQADMDLRVADRFHVLERPQSRNPRMKRLRRFLKYVLSFDSRVLITNKQKKAHRSSFKKMNYFLTMSDRRDYTHRYALMLQFSVQPNLITKC